MVTFFVPLCNEHIYLHPSKNQGVYKYLFGVWIEGKSFAAKCTEKVTGFLPIHKKKEWEVKAKKLAQGKKKKKKSLFLLASKGPLTCGMPYLSIICQIYQSSFLEAFRNLKVVTKAYSSGRPCGKTSLAWGGEREKYMRQYIKHSSEEKNF